MKQVGINQAWQPAVWSGCLELLGVEGLTANHLAENLGFPGIAVRGMLRCRRPHPRNPMGVGYSQALRPRKNRPH